jgi:hypothetical protein
MALIDCNESEIEYKQHPNHKRFVDLTGHRFGQLTVLGYAGFINAHSWFCRCDCGIIKTIQGPVLKRHQQKSCGCMFSKEHSERMTKHGNSVKGAVTPEYHCYLSAKYRCTKSSHRSFSEYGGRGIQFRFESFSEFIGELGKKPTPLHSIDRIDNDGNYEPGNVRWATSVEQSNNKRSTRKVVIDGNAVPRMELVESVVEPNDLRAKRRVVWRLNKGWCHECAVNAKAGVKCVHLARKRRLFKLQG